MLETSQSKKKDETEEVHHVDLVITFEDKTEEWNYRASAGLTFGSLREKAGEHFGVKKSKYHDYAIMLGGTDCTASQAMARCTLMGSGAQKNGIELKDGSKLRLAAYEKK